MGYPGKNHKQYEKPTRKFEKERQADEVRLLVNYGLRNKREIRKSQMVLRRFRRAARDITAMSSAGVDPKVVETKKRQMLEHLERMGFLGADADIESVLSLKVEQQSGAAPPDRRIPEGARPFPEAGKAVRHPRPHHDRYTKGHHPRLSREPDRGEPGLLCHPLAHLKRGPP